MSKTVQIRDIDDEVYLALTRRAAEIGMSVPEMLRREAVRLAEVLDAIDGVRGPWPDAGR